MIHTKDTVSNLLLTNFDDLYKIYENTSPRYKPSSAFKSTQTS